MGFLIFLVAAFAECNRLPFDLPEAEQELVGGYHTEYSALKFGLFFVGEYTHMVTTSFLLAIIFFGGWHLKWIAEADSGVVIKVIVLVLKVTFFILFYMFVRWTIPRFRFDQLMGLAWKVLIPLALANVVAVMIIKELNNPSLEWWLFPVVSVLLLLGTAALGARMPPTPRRPVVVSEDRSVLIPAER